MNNDRKVSHAVWETFLAAVSDGHFPGRHGFELRNHEAGLKYTHA